MFGGCLADFYLQCAENSARDTLHVVISILNNEDCSKRETLSRSLICMAALTVMNTSEQA